MTEFCLIFDLDGTLVDSELINAQALKTLFDALPCEAQELALTYRGWKLATILEDIQQHYGLIPKDGVVDEYHATVERLFASQLRPFEGVVEALEALPQRKCVASSAPTRKIEVALRATDLSRFFGADLFSSYDVGYWKPDPTLFVFAAKNLGFPPHKCVVIEDSEVGITAAQSAGMIPIHFGDTAKIDTDCLKFSKYHELPGLITETVRQYSQKY